MGQPEHSAVTDLTHTRFVIARSTVTRRFRSRDGLPCPYEIAALRSQ